MTNINGINTLSKFGTKLDGVNQRVKFNHLKTRYRAKFVGFAGTTTDGENLTMELKSFEVPSGQFQTEKIETVNGTIKYPGLWSWNDVSFTAFNSYDNAIYRAIQNQVQRQRDIYEQTTGDAPNKYKFTAIFEHVDGAQNTLSYWVLEGCFITDYKSDGGENGEHASMMISGKIAYDNATLYDKDGNQIPTATRGIVTDIVDALAK